jgi:hypothetical protein
VVGTTTNKPADEERITGVTQTDHTTAEEIVGSTTAEIPETTSTQSISLTEFIPVTDTILLTDSESTTSVGTTTYFPDTTSVLASDIILTTASEIPTQPESTTSEGTTQNLAQTTSGLVPEVVKTTYKHKVTEPGSTSHKISSQLSLTTLSITRTTTNSLSTSETGRLTRAMFTSTELPRSTGSKHCGAGKNTTKSLPVLKPTATRQGVEVTTIKPKTTLPVDSEYNRPLL